MRLAFEVHGIPGAQGSKRHVGRGIMVESSKKVTPWRQDVKAAAEAALLASDEWETGYRGAVSVKVWFRFIRPKDHYGTGRNADQLKATAPKFVISRGAGDIEKLLRSTFDALVHAGVIHDDSQIVSVIAMKSYRTVSGAAITLETMP